eukprot:4420536-Prorocentrum_lima.AAC.1
MVHHVPYAAVGWRCTQQQSWDCKAGIGAGCCSDNPAVAGVLFWEGHDGDTLRVDWVWRKVAGGPHPPWLRCACACGELGGCCAGIMHTAARVGA